MNDNHESLHDESDETLDRAICAAKAQSAPSDVKNRVIEIAAAWQRQVHIAVGDQPPAVGDALVEEEREVRSGFEAIARSLGPIEQSVLEEQEHPLRVRVGISNNHFFEKVKNMIVTHKRLSAATAAALTALAASLVLCVSLFSASGSAYALEQIAQANQHMTNCHVKTTPAPMPGTAELWLQLGPDGTVIRARLDGQARVEGPYIMVMADGKGQTWFKAKNTCFNSPMPDVFLKEIAGARESFDPKLLFAKLQAAQKAGEVQIATQEPSQEGQPITLTTTGKDGHREVYDVNPKTKVVERVIVYRGRDDKGAQVSDQRSIDFTEIDPKVFQLDLPKGVVTSEVKVHPIDRERVLPGLVKGDLTEDEIATKVVREFYEALIAEDYDKAGLICNGMPEQKMKESLGGYKVLRIVEMGKPAPVHDPKLEAAITVPIKVEREGKERKEVESVWPTVRITDVEMATKAVRQFYEAIAVQDEATARRIYQETGLVEKGIGCVEDLKLLKEFFAKQHIKSLRIVEIGKPVPHPEAGTTEVPVKIEAEVMASGKEFREFSPNVVPAYGHADRRVICGNY